MQKIKSLAILLFSIAMCMGISSCEEPCDHKIDVPTIKCQAHSRFYGAHEYNNICIGTITASEKLSAKDVIVYDDFVSACIENPSINDNGQFVYPVYANIKANSTDETRKIQFDISGRVDIECDCGCNKSGKTHSSVFQGTQWAPVTNLIPEPFVGTWELTSAFYANGTKYSKDEYTTSLMTLKIDNTTQGNATNVNSITEFPGSGSFTYSVNGDKITFYSRNNSTTYNVIVIEYNLFMLEHLNENSFHTLTFERQNNLENL